MQWKLPRHAGQSHAKEAALMIFHRHVNFQFLQKAQPHSSIIHHSLPLPAGRRVLLLDIRYY